MRAGWRSSQQPVVKQVVTAPFQSLLQEGRLEEIEDDEASVSTSTQVRQVTAMLAKSAEEQVKPFEKSPHFQLAEQVVAAEDDPLGDEWRSRSLYNEQVILLWAAAQHQRPSRSGSAACERFQRWVFPQSLNTSNNAAAHVWNGERGILRDAMKQVILGDPQRWPDILGYLTRCTQCTENNVGIPPLYEIFRVAAGDRVLWAHPPLQAAIILMAADNEFASYSSEFSKATESAAWDRCVSRRPCR